MKAIQIQKFQVTLLKIKSSV